MFRCRILLRLVPVVLVACGNKLDPPPPLVACNSETCNPTAIKVGGSTGGSTNGGGASTSGVDLSVSVVEFTQGDAGLNGWSTQNVRLIDDALTVRASGASGAPVTLTTSDNPFKLLNITDDGSGWVTVTPGADSGFLPGMQQVPLEPGPSLIFPLLRKRDFDFVPTLFSTKALSIDLTRAQVVVKFVDTLGAGVPGLAVPDFGGEAMAYAASGTWADANSGLGTRTDSSGLVVGINLVASTTTVHYLSASATGTTALGAPRTATGLVPFMAGFVTYGTLRVQ